MWFIVPASGGKDKIQYGKGRMKFLNPTKTDVGATVSKPHPENTRKFPISRRNPRKIVSSGRISKNRRNAAAPEVGPESSETVDIIEEIACSSPSPVDGSKRSFSAPGGIRSGRAQKRWIPQEDHGVTRQKAFTRTERENGPKTGEAKIDLRTCPIRIKWSIILGRLNRMYPTRIRVSDSLLVQVLCWSRSLT